jgi:hypothetical protein
MQKLLVVSLIGAAIFLVGIGQRGAEATPFGNCLELYVGSTTILNRTRNTCRRHPDCRPGQFMQCTDKGCRCVDCPPDDGR